MEQNDIDTIFRSLPEVKNLLNLSGTFLNLLLTNRVFSKEMIEDIMRKECPSMELCIMLVRRGPKAFSNFVAALTETNQQAVISAMERARTTLGQPAHRFIPPPSNHQENSTTDAKEPTFRFPPISSSNNNSDEYRNKVLEPPSYAMFSPPEQPSLTNPSLTDPIPVPDSEIWIEVDVKLSTEVRGSGKDSYLNVHKNPRGLALILNYQSFHGDIVSPRNGSEKDVIHLDQLLKQLGYNVQIHSNLTYLETIEVLDAFTESKLHDDADSTVIAIMSHGKSGTLEDGTYIYTKDGRSSLASEDILRRFNNMNCPLLKGKPKIFLFQFCRGDNIDIGTPSPKSPMMVSLGRRTVTDGHPTLSIPPMQYERAFDDMLIAYSTLPGFVSYREPEGTWFIKALCLIFMEHAHEYHVDRLFQEVDKQIKHWTGNKNGKQTLDISRRGFNLKFYFNPGMWRASI